jgi:large subunit ribosomal protein L19
MDAHDWVTLEKNTRINEFSPGDTVNVNIKIKEGDRERVQAFQGVAIRKRGKGPGSSFTVRRVAHGIGVERTFLFYSPVIESVDVIKRGVVRQARLYYLRGLFGKAARIKEKGRIRR